MHYGGIPLRHGIDPADSQKSIVFMSLKMQPMRPVQNIRDRKCGLIGDVGCFSFFSNKNLVTGEGGMVVTRDKELAEGARGMRSHGMEALSWDKYRGHLSSYDIKRAGL